jgi:hypothetical protein
MRNAFRNVVRTSSIVIIVGLKYRAQPAPLLPQGASQQMRPNRQSAQHKRYAYKIPHHFTFLAAAFCVGHNFIITLLPSGRSLTQGTVV